jgi:hypothetical protein
MPKPKAAKNIKVPAYRKPRTKKPLALEEVPARKVQVRRLIADVSKRLMSGLLDAREKGQHQMKLRALLKEQRELDQK